MPEILALYAPFDILPSVSELQPRQTSPAGTACLVYEDRGQLATQKGLQADTIPPVEAQSRWAMLCHGSAPELQLASHAGGLVVAALGALENHAALAREVGLAATAGIAEVLLGQLRALLATETMSEALLQLRQRLKGYLGLIVHQLNAPDELYACSLGWPLHLGVRNGQLQLCGSELSLVRQLCSQTHTVQSGEVLRFGKEAPVALHGDGSLHPVALLPSSQQARLPHFMLEEIYAQPGVLASLASQEVQGQSQISPALRQELAGISHVLLLACGSSFHSAQIASYWLETLGGVTVQVELTSEYRYRDTQPPLHTLVIAISQSGETSDTLASLRHTQAQGLQCSVAISNTASSSLVKLARYHILPSAGIERAIYSTKTFTAQLLALYQLALALGRARGRVSAEREQEAREEMLRLPALINATLQLAPLIREWAQRLARQQNLFVIGRNIHYPVAMEGAFKLKEVAYLHAEGFPAGELKHGPITLVDGSLPVVACLPWNLHAEKALANLQEVRARSGEIFAFTDAALAPVERFHVIRLPAGLTDLSPLIYTVALQLLAYYCAVIRGNDIDTPRNLAKSQDSEIPAAAG